MNPDARHTDIGRPDFIDGTIAPPPPPQHMGNPTLRSRQLVLADRKREDHPYWHRFAIELGQVVGRHPDSYSVDVVMRDGGLIENVSVMSVFSGSSGAEYLPNFHATTQGKSSTLDAQIPYNLPGIDDLLAIVGFFDGNTQQPVVLGFMPPLYSQLFVTTPGLALSLHESGIWQIRTPDGAEETHFPGGTVIRIGQGSTLHDMANENQAFKPPTLSTPETLTLTHPTGTSVSISSTGEVTITVAAGQTLNLGGTGGSAVARAGDPVSVDVGGTQYSGTITSGSSVVTAK